MSFVAEPRRRASPDYFLRAEAPLWPDNAVAAILLLEDGRYIMQLRDVSPSIFYPDHWGCFGGAVEAGELPLDALRRELLEEIELLVEEGREFTCFDFDFRALGRPKVFRSYYEVRVTADAFRRMTLHEGADIRAFDGVELLALEKVTPYDAFAIWIHISRRRFA